LNFGHKRLGDTPAFKLEGLLNVDRVKSNESSNLLRYLIDYAQETYPEILHWEEDLQSVKVASQVDMKVVEEEYGNIEKDLITAVQLVGKVKQSDNDLDIFLTKMKPLLDELKNKKIDDSKEKLKVLVDDIKGILKFYAINDPDIITFWKTIVLQFMESFDKAKKDNEMDKIKKQKEALKEEKKRQLDEKRTQRGGTDETGVVEGSTERGRGGRGRPMRGGPRGRGRGRSRRTSN